MVPVASEDDIFPDLIFGAEQVAQMGPQWTGLGQELHVAQDVESVTGARERHADTIGDAQKPNRFIGIVADEREDDDVVLFTLIVVDDRHGDALDIGTESLVAVSGELKQLGSVRRQDRDILR